MAEHSLRVDNPSASVTSSRWRAGRRVEQLFPVRSSQACAPSALSSSYRRGAAGLHPMVLRPRRAAPRGAPPNSGQARAWWQGISDTSSASALRLNNRARGHSYAGIDAFRSARCGPIMSAQPKDRALRLSGNAPDAARRRFGHVAASIKCAVGKAVSAAPALRWNPLEGQQHGWRGIALRFRPSAVPARHTTDAFAHHILEQAVAFPHGLLRRPAD